MAENNFKLFFFLLFAIGKSEVKGVQKYSIHQQENSSTWNSLTHRQGFPVYYEQVLFYIISLSVGYIAGRCPRPTTSILEDSYVVSRLVFVPIHVTHKMHQFYMYISNAQSMFNNSVSYSTYLYGLCITKLHEIYVYIFNAQSTFND